MTAGYKIINEDFVTIYDNKLGGIVVYNYSVLNEVVNHFVGYEPTVDDSLTSSNLLGFWKVKKLK